MAVPPAAAAPAPPEASPRTLVAAEPAGKAARIVTVNASNGTLRALTDGQANDSNPAWSPDGRRIIFVSDRDGPRNVYVMNADGGKVRQVTKEKGGCAGPRWSPDGRRIAYLVGAAGAEQVSLIDVDGGNLRALTKGPLACRQPAWSPDGKKLIYSRYGPGVFDTLVVNADGTGATSLTGDGGGLDGAWSPDGKRIAFMSLRESGGGVGFRLYVMDADGKNVARYSTAENVNANVSPAWSPDGKRIAFGDLVKGALQVRVCDADGQNLTTLTTAGSNALARWSADGRKIAFGHYEANEPPSLWVMGADGQDAHEVLRGTPLGDWKPK